VRKHLREKAAAVVVLNSDLHFQYCGAVAARLEKLPILCRKSGGIAEGLRIKKLLTPLVDVFVPISKAAEKDQLTNPATKRSVVVYEGVDMSEYRGRRPNPGLRSKLGLPENKKVVTSVARLAAGKGQAELIEAAARVIRKQRFSSSGRKLRQTARLHLVCTVASCGWDSQTMLCLPAHAETCLISWPLPTSSCIAPQLGSKTWEFAISRQWLRESHL